jgi:Uma2 family endonuclease
MKAALKLGPADHGRPLSYEDFLAGDYVEGYHYELIDGKLYVSAQPNPPQCLAERWLFRKLDRYSEEHSDVINFVYVKTRVFVPQPGEVTAPEPDIAAYHDFPVDADPDDIRWQEATPLLVVEVISPDDPNKDLVRNRELYLQVPTICEYWVLDPRRDARQPSLRVHRRVGRRWRIRNLAGGKVYSTSLLPGLELRLDIRT